MRFAGKVALVTGAASGIGAACVRRLAAEGAEVAGIDREATPLPDAPGGLALTADVRDEAAVAAAVAAVVDRFGRLDVLVNAAGVAGGG
ncbi:MAG TPA: SDR family NAD(P)-dependent oxidoreductase, partial [Candidatus Limnocylindria bacterium]|nr:SDR family NAD(P)-dependent oxidoreductase [Candidatus Limnocylindria bacterium]